VTPEDRARAEGFAQGVERAAEYADACERPVTGDEIRRLLSPVEDEPAPLNDFIFRKGWPS
jgi:hypothetical protein